MRMKLTSRFLALVLADRRGVTAAEYAILAVGIVIVVGASLMVLKDPVNSAFAQVGTTLTNAISSLASAR